MKGGTSWISRKGEGNLRKEGVDLEKGGWPPFQPCRGYTGCWIYLHKPECALVLYQYVLIYLSIAKYDWIYWYIPEKTECWICQNSECSDAGFVELGHFNISSKTQEKEAPQGNILTQRWTQSRPFFPKSGHLLENAWINCSNYARALNMHDHHHLACLTGFWRCLKF